MRPRLPIAIVVALSTCLVGCTVASRSATGRFAVGVEDAAGITGPIEIWYPAKHTAGDSRPAAYDLRSWLPPSLAAKVPPGVFTHSLGGTFGLPAIRGRFPLVLFAHGLYSQRDQSSFLASWLASQGFVVASPELPRDLTAWFSLPGHEATGAPSDYEVLVATEERLRSLGADPASPLFHRLRPGVVAVVGHSLGGLDAIQFATRPEVAAYVSLAAGFDYPPGRLPKKPSLYVAAADDADVRLGAIEATYQAAAQPKSLIELPRAGHLAFTDLCDIGLKVGGLAKLGSVLGVDPLSHAPFSTSALNGCGHGFAPAKESHRLIDKAVLAFLSKELQRRARSAS
jgi:dienelactone hydrolase